MNSNNDRFGLISIKASLIGLLLGCATFFVVIPSDVLSAAEFRPSEKHRVFPIWGYHQHIFPDRQSMRVVHDRLRILKDYGYNLVVFGMGSPGKATITMQGDGTIAPNGCSTKAMAELVRHAIDLGLEPVFEMKFIGKQLRLLRGMIDRYPDLVIDPHNSATVLNAAFRMPDGRSAYSATSLRMVDYLLGLYPEEHPAKYFFFGIDEFSADDMASLAAKLDMSPPRAFAYCLNLGTDHVLGRGITPLVWGDTMLSPALGTASHGLTLAGYQPDSRLALEAGGAYHAAFGKSRDQGLHTMVNYLRDRDKIIVVDWHYSPSPTGEFPSVDYFQEVGFKDVWGAPWHNAENIRQFSRYAAKRKCGGMLATAWGDAFTPQKRLMLHFIIGTSAAYFADPNIDPPPASPIQFLLRGSHPSSVDDEKHAGCFSPSDRTLVFRAAVREPITPRDGRLLVCGMKSNGPSMERPLQFDVANRELAGTIQLPETKESTQYQVQYCYTDTATGYVYLKQDMQGFFVTGSEPIRPEVHDASVLLEGDFVQLDMRAMRRGVWLGGSCAGPIGWAAGRHASGDKMPRSGGLDTEWFDRVWFSPSAFLNDVLPRGMRIHIEAKMTGHFTGDGFCALLTKGGYQSGFRVLVSRDRRLLFQLAGADTQSTHPLGVASASGSIPLERWTSIDLLYEPPLDQDPGRAVIFINGKQVAKKSVERAMIGSSALLGIGCEFTKPTAGPVGKRRPNFPGLIRRITIRSIKH